MSGRKAEEFLGCIFHKVVAFYPQMFGERNVVGAVGFVFGIVHGLHFFGFSIGIVGDDEFYGVQDGGNSAGFFVQIVANGGFEQRHVVQGIEFGVANRVDEASYAFGRISSAAHSTECGHARIVPAVHQFFVYEHV